MQTVFTSPITRWPARRIARAAAAILRPARIASAHCDSTEGPVAGPARKALESGDVRLVLPFVKPAEEAELIAAFAQAMQVRAAGGEARQLADRSFAETAVRLHRQGEGASYTGLQPAAELPPALAAAELALETGELDDVFTRLDREIHHGVEARYHAVLAARQQESREGTVEAARARVEAEFTFEKYVLGISESAHSSAHTEPVMAMADHRHD